MKTETLFQLGLLLVTLPLWWPLAKRLYLSTWEAGAEERGPEAEARDPDSDHTGERQRAQVFSDEGDAWTHRRRVNPVWDTGRRPPRRSGFRRPA